VTIGSVNPGLVTVVVTGIWNNNIAVQEFVHEPKRKTIYTHLFKFIFFIDTAIAIGSISKRENTKKNKVLT